LTASQKAVLAADIDDGVVGYQPTMTALAETLDVSVPMVQRAKRLSPLARQHVMSGAVTLGYYAAQMARVTTKKPPITTVELEPVDLEKEDDEILAAIIKRRGVDHVVDIAAAVEAAQ
jgi:hypothetical protein